MFFTTMLACMVAGVVIHELGHIAVLSYYGHKIRALAIGLPMKPFIKIPLRAVADELYITPYLWAGATFPKFKQKPTASGWLFIHLGGPGSNLLVLTVIFLFRGSSEFISAAYLFTPHIIDVGFWELFIIFNFVYVGELIPFIGKDGTVALNVIRGKYS